MEDQVDIRTLIEQLQRPECYPHSATSVDVVQTHTSCVFLTGEYAYKVKKPVNLGFLDYSTLEKRKEFCEKELEVNGRLCPDVYVDIVAITGKNGVLKVNGKGEVADWALRMRQLNVDHMLPGRLDAGTIGRADIQQIAQAIADFHEKASCWVAPSALCDPRTIASTVRDACDVFDSVAVHVPEDRRKSVRQYLDAFYRQNNDKFWDRSTTCMIRECHGDLRTQNICLDPRYSGGVQLFDAIEFNDKLRFVDVAADLAYLAMDLDLAGHSDLREILVATYLQITKDKTLHEMLPYYQTYRAVVRGNIAMIAVMQREVTDIDRERHHRVADAAYDLAAGYASKRDRPALIIMVGLSGSGKSTLARELCRRLPGVLLSSDGIRQEDGWSTTLNGQRYSSEGRAAIYSELRHRTMMHLSCKEHVVLDATFASATEREAVKALAQEYGAEFWIVDCHCPDEVIRQRLSASGESRHGSEATIAVYERQVKSFQPVPEETDNYILADTTQEIGRLAGRVTDRFIAGPNAAALSVNRKSVVTAGRGAKRINMPLRL